MDPSGDAAIQLIILLILLMLSAFFSSAETALTTVNKIRMRTLAENGHKRAETVIKIIEDQGKMLSAILIGNNVVNLSASSLLTMLATDFFGSKAVGIATGILTLLILVFLAPFVEETLFRGLVFGGLKEKSRPLAYAVSCALFALVHVWQFAVANRDPAYFLQMVQYLIPGLVLAWAYDHSGTLWASIGLHAGVNALSALAGSL